MGEFFLCHFVVVFCTEYSKTGNYKGRNAVPKHCYDEQDGEFKNMPPCVILLLVDGSVASPPEPLIKDIAEDCKPTSQI